MSYLYFSLPVFKLFRKRLEFNDDRITERKTSFKKSPLLLWFQKSTVSLLHHQVNKAGDFKNPICKILNKHGLHEDEMCKRSKRGSLCQTSDFCQGEQGPKITFWMTNAVVYLKVLIKRFFMVCYISYTSIKHSSFLRFKNLMTCFWHFCVKIPKREIMR